MKELVNKVRDAIVAKDRQLAEVLLSKGLREDPNKFVAALREKGVLRTSRYYFNPAIVSRLADLALNSSGAGLSESSRTYLKSVLALCELAPAVAMKLKKVQESVNSGLFKSFLVTTELLFRRMHVRERAERITSWRNYGLEELAGGFSYYFSLLREKEAVEITDLNKLMSLRIDSDFYLDRLGTLASIARFREAEFQIEAFPFEATTSGSETIIKAVSPLFEKAVRWGYISSEEQRNADRHRWTPEGIPSLKVLAAEFVERTGKNLFEVIEGPQARIRIHFPVVKEFIDFFAGNEFLAEDSAFVKDAMKSLFVTEQQLLATPIYKSVTLVDVLKFRRLCIFLQAALDEFCRRKNLLNSQQYYASLVAHFNEEQADEWISTFCGVADAKSLLHLLCSTDGEATVFDVQYTPVLRVAKQYLLPIAVVANSNVMRNALQQSRYRFDSGGRTDPLGDRLVAAFQHSGIKAKARNKIRYAGAELEVDVVALVENRLFAFECKNSLHPCNSYELRQSYDYLLKAASQLSRFRDLFSDLKFRSVLSQFFGFDVSSANSLTTCIATGNRMFSGFREGGHAVRNLYELENVVVGGSAVIIPYPKDPNQPDGPKIAMKIKPWVSQSLAASDLVNYIENDSWHSTAFDAMAEIDEVIPFGKKAMRFKSFILDVDRYRELLLKHPNAIIETEIG